MYKAVLVDDENFDLLGMQRLIPWQALNIEIAYSSNKPLAALNYMNKHELDILITDIKMPVMSGLELAKIALQKHKHLKVIFISGYQDFEYAKQALHMKADGYILKPVDDDEIIAALKEIVTSLDIQTEREREQQDDTISSFTFIKQDFLLHLMDGTIDEATLTAFLRKYPMDIPNLPAHAVIVEVDDTARKRMDLNDSLQLVMNHICSFIEQNGLGICCQLSLTRIGIIYSGETAQIESELSRLIQYVRSSSSFTVTISYGHLARDTACLPASFREALDLMSIKMFKGKDRVISPNIFGEPAIPHLTDIHVLLDQLFTAMSSYALVEICDCIEELFDSVKGSGDPIHVYHFSTHVIARLEGYLIALGESYESLADWKEYGFATVQQFETIHDIKSWLRRAVFEWSELIYQKKHKREWKLLVEIEGYVKNNLSNDITLKEASSHFSYSANHFGFLFKEQVGISFNDYVVSLRMDKARELLQLNGLKVYEIADLVGYRSLTYFSRVFKETFGMTPGDYRKQS